MFEIIVLIFIGVAIYKKIQSAKENGSSKSLPNTTVTTANQTMPQTSAPPKATVQSRPTPPMVQSRPVQPIQSRPVQPVQHKPNQPVQQYNPAQEAKEDGNTTTAYLMEKAEADAREHAREKFEEQKRLHETRGGLAVAERYLDGDTVPQGKRIVNCGYCGAENLMPMMPRTKYSCYFCREPL